MSKNLYLLLFAILLTACETDIDVIGEWKETAVVYGLLNPYDSVQYLKINKTFLGEKDALIMAQEFDSIHYGDELNVSLERWKDGLLLSNISLTKETSINKDPGIFAYPDQILYKIEDSIYQDSEYKLVLYNSASGKTFTSQTPIVDNIEFDNILLYSTTINFINSQGYEVKWNSTADGKLYGFTLRFYYTEESVINPTQITEKYIDWVFSDLTSNTTKGGEQMQISITKDAFYKFMAAIIPIDNSVHRYAGKLDFIFTTGAEDLSTYIEVSQPSTGIVQERPYFTNIEGGVGIFSSRLTQIIKGKNLSSSSVDTLACGYLTKNLGFASSTGQFCN